MLEFEKKVLLTGKEYTLLRNRMAAMSLLVEQTNYYYDTDDLALNTLGITCRVRRKEHTFTATIKTHHPAKKEISYERSLPVSGVLESFPFGHLKLNRLGYLTTIRATFIPADGIVIAMDKNMYHNLVDYELEIEYPPGWEQTAQRHLSDIAALLGVAPGEWMRRSGQGKSKSERFFSTGSFQVKKTGKGWVYEPIDCKRDCKTTKREYAFYRFPKQQPIPSGCRGKRRF